MFSSSRIYCRIPLMQLIINLSKIFILAFLTCCLLVAWNETNIINVDFSSASFRPTIISQNNMIVENKLNDSIWLEMRRQFKLDTKLQSAQVKKEIRALLSEQDKLYSILKSASPYIYFIYQQIQARGLPAEIALIPVIESEFNPNDYSKKGAMGLWQLMAGTAHELGVKVKSGYDGRRNVVASTNAALTYFNDLGDYFHGDWYLAIAAYNSGQIRVKSAMKKTGSNDFWHLPLPRETKLYVPRLLAVAAIIKDPEKYGVQLPNITNEPYFSEIKMSKPVHLDQVAKLSGTNIKVLKALNPDYRQGKPPQKESQTLLVPVNKVSIVRDHYGVNK
jgi:membrane-bound lytic murein transglycosylase D